MRNYFLVILPFLALVQSISAMVYTYPGASETLRSAVYEVSVSQNGTEQTSFVYADANTFTEQKYQMSDWNHWSCFSFDGTITVKVKKLTSGAISGCKIYPITDSIQPTISGNEVTFTLSKPAKLFVSVSGMNENPLFIFADEPEQDIPSPTDANVVYWGPGVHNIGEHYTLNSNTTYYLAGGAYVKGSFLSVNNGNNIHIRGRGILSGIDIAHCSYNNCGFDKVAIHIPANNNSFKNYIEGITITNPGQYCIQSYGGYLETRNVKCFGWWYETDGWVGGDGSKLWDSFFKVNDDVVKLYFKDMQINDLVIYHQQNGAPFQFAWGAEQGRNGTVNNIDIVADESTSLGNNHSMINAANGSASNNVIGMKFDNIRADQDLTAIFGLKTSGTVSNIEITNLLVRGKVKFTNYLTNGTFNNLVLRNISIGGTCTDNIAGAGGLVSSLAKSVDLRYMACNEPYINITAPQTGVQNVEDEWVRAGISVIDPQNNIVRYTLFVNDEPIENYNSNPGEIIIKGLKSGSNKIVVAGYNAQNTPFTSNMVTIITKPKELVSLYHFEYNGADETGRYSGWMNNDDVYDVGYKGMAPVFDGVNDRMTLNNRVFGNMSYAFWINTTTPGTVGAGNWFDGSGLIDGKSSSTGIDFGISLLGKQVSVGTGGPDITLISAAEVTDGNWHHVAVTRNSNSGEAIIYIDGKESARAVLNTGERTSATRITIGSNMQLTQYFKGLLDELAIYNYVLSPQDITGIIALGTKPISHEPQVAIVTGTPGHGFTISTTENMASIAVYNMAGMLLNKNKADGKMMSVTDNDICHAGIYLVSIRFANGHEIHRKVSVN